MRRKQFKALTVQMTETEYKEVDELARILERSKVDVMRLAVRRWLAQVQAEGAHKHNPIAQVIKLMK